MMHNNNTEGTMITTPSQEDMRSLRPMPAPPDQSIRQNLPSTMMILTFFDDEIFENEFDQDMTLENESTQDPAVEREFAQDLDLGNEFDDDMDAFMSQM